MELMYKINVQYSYTEIIHEHARIVTRHLGSLIEKKEFYVLIWKQ